MQTVKHQKIHPYKSSSIQVSSLHVFQNQFKHKETWRTRLEFNHAGAQKGSKKYQDIVEEQAERQKVATMKP